MKTRNYLDKGAGTRSQQAAPRSAKSGIRAAGSALLDTGRAPAKSGQAPRKAATRSAAGTRYNFDDAATVRAVLAEYAPGAAIVQCRRGGYRVTF